MTHEQMLLKLYLLRTQLARTSRC